MGLILGLFFFFYLIIYCLGGLWYLIKVKGVKNKLKLLPLPFCSSVGFGWLYLWLLFSGSRDQEIYAFEFCFNILLSLPTTLILITGLTVFIRLRKKRDNLFHAFFASIPMIPFTALCLLILFENDFSSAFNITYHY